MTTEQPEAAGEHDDAAAVVLPCPFCGKAVDFEDDDTLHPTGTGWSDDKLEGFRTYHGFREAPKEQWCWGMHCPTSAGGCGAEITGDSRDEALEKWSRRAANKACEAATITHDNDCICRGNWRAIVKESEHLIGERFTANDGREYVFFGLVHGATIITTE